MARGKKKKEREWEEGRVGCGITCNLYLAIRILRLLLPDVEWTYSSVNIFGFETIYLVLFLPVAASPLYCFGYLYCYCFFYIIINNDILQRALQSVTKNCRSSNAP